MNYKLGIIGGSGLYDLVNLKSKRWLPIKEGPFGLPSDQILCGLVDEVEIFFLPRHGRNHNYSPTNIPFRANIDALKRLGCNDIISLSAVGSLREELKPGMFVIVDQFIDKTIARKKTFFDSRIVAHVSMAKPICEQTASIVFEASKKISLDVVYGGTYLAMEGPQFSSYAESELYRSWNCDVIGMTNMPEAKLAREAEMRYVTIAMVTDYDCWHKNEQNVDVQEIIEVMNKNTNNAKKLLNEFIKHFKKNRPRKVEGIDDVLDSAIISKNITKEDFVELGLDAIASRIIDAGK